MSSVADIIRIHRYRAHHQHVIPIILSIIGVATIIFYISSRGGGDQRRIVSPTSFSSRPTPLPIIVCTRFWGHTLEDLNALHLFLIRTVEYAQHVIVAINMDKDPIDTRSAVTRWNLPHVISLAVTPWYGMSTALNAGLLESATRNYTHILYQSIEIKATREHISVLLTELDDETICTGAYLEGAHEFQPGIHPISGSNIPWNTIALWHVPTLLRVGFLPVSDGLMPGSTAKAGVEEMPVMALLQTLAAHQDKLGGEDHTLRQHVKLIKMRDPVIWIDDFKNDPSRKKWQQQKLATKTSRGSAHTRALGVRASFVFHIVQDTHGGSSHSLNPNHQHAQPQQQDTPPS